MCDKLLVPCSSGEALPAEPFTRHFIKFKIVSFNRTAPPLGGIQRGFLHFSSVKVKGFGFLEVLCETDQNRAA